jgi:hypothetical protein
MTTQERTSEIFDLLKLLQTWIEKLASDNDSEITKKFEALNNWLNTIERALLCLQKQIDDLRGT